MNNRAELIERWKTIASAVFKAEDEIKTEWFPRLKQTTKENAAEVADADLTAIATEIIDNSQMKFEDEDRSD